MNIQQIKADISAKCGVNMPVLQLNRQKDEKGVDQPWVAHWDNDNRIRVTMHDDVLKLIMADSSFAGLALKKAVVPATADRAEYLRFVVITPQNIVATF